MLEYKLKDIFLKWNRFAIITHNNPDPDTLWSAAALKIFIQKLWKTADVFCSDKIPIKYNFIIDWMLDKIEKDYEYFVYVDMWDPLKQTNIHWSWYKIVIDHHEWSSEYWDLIYRKSYISTSSIVFEFLEKNFSTYIDKEIATKLYIWHIFDSFSCTWKWSTKEDVLTAYKMLSYWVDKDYVIENLYYSSDYYTIKFWWILLDRLNKINNLVYTYYFEYEIENLIKQDVDYIVEIARKIKEVDYYVLIRFLNDYARISIRSKIPNAHIIAKKLWWWWHKYAAAFTLKYSDFKDIDFIIKIIMNNII